MQLQFLLPPPNPLKNKPTNTIEYKIYVHYLWAFLSAYYNTQDKLTIKSLVNNVYHVQEL